MGDRPRLERLLDAQPERVDLAARAARAPDIVNQTNVWMRALADDPQRLCPALAASTLVENVKQATIRDGDDRAGPRYAARHS